MVNKMNDQMDRLRLFCNCLSSKNSKKEILGLSFALKVRSKRAGLLGEGYKQSMKILSSLREESVSSDIEQGLRMGVSGHTGSSLQGNSWVGRGRERSEKRETGSIAGR